MEPLKLTNHQEGKFIAKRSFSDIITLFYCYKVASYKNVASNLWKVLGKQGDKKRRFKVDFKLDKVR